MHAVSPRQEGASLSFPGALAGCVWRGDQLGAAREHVLPTGHAALDQVLPGGGWPCRGLTEILQPEAAMAEWRLLGPALRLAVAQGGAVVVIGAPEMPHLPGLHLGSQAESSLVWIRPQSAAQALWATEQALHCRQTAAVLAWLPQAKAQALRRLQVHAQQGDAPVFVFRHSAAERESSPAPLRLSLEPGRAWSLRVRLLKRRGPVHEGVIELPCLPQRLAGVLAVRLAGRVAGKPAVSEQAKRLDLMSLPSGKSHGALAGFAADPVFELSH